MKIDNDKRIVMTLDAGGTNLVFSAIRGGLAVTETVTIPSEVNDLQRLLKKLSDGFELVRAQCPEPPIAISFAFPGPADYPQGIIGDLGNLPCFRGGIPLGPILEAQFGIPVYINNDGDLFVYGEAIAGFLPYVNDLLEKAGSPKRFRNLFGITLGTGFGGGIVRNNELFVGDNSMAGEIWLLRNKLDPQMNAEEGACIRAIQRTYAQKSGIPFEETPDPRVIEAIAKGDVTGNQNAAKEAYRRFGEVVGDALGNALTLIDGLAVIGGGLSKGHALFLPEVVSELNSCYTGPNGNRFQRLASRVFNLEDPAQRDAFLKGEKKEIALPGSTQKIQYDPLQRLGIGISRLGTSEAVAIGAYAFALNKLDQ